MKDLSGLKPLLKRVWDKHFDMEKVINDMLHERQQYITEFYMEHHKNVLNNEMRDLFKELYAAQVNSFEEKIKPLAVESEMSKRLDEKCSKYDYGAMMHEFTDLRCSLLPLIEKKTTLEKFI